MTKTQMEYSKLIAKWYYLTPTQLSNFSGKELKTIQNQLKTMFDNKYLKRIKQPYTNEYVYGLTTLGYKSSAQNYWREKTINLYNFFHTKAIIDFIIKTEPKSYITERELISELYSKGKPTNLRTPDLVIGTIAYEFERTFKSKARYIKVIDQIDNQLSKKVYSKWVWIIAKPIKPKLELLIKQNSLSDTKLIEFQEMEDPEQISIFEEIA